MRYCITGNTTKASFWPPLLELLGILIKKGLPFCFTEEIAQGLAVRGEFDTDFRQKHVRTDICEEKDSLIISFGGDGTMLTTAYQIGKKQRPILGVNIGRLGFLAGIEIHELDRAIDHIEAGQYQLDSRLVLEAVIDSRKDGKPRWALNEFVLDKSGSASMISIHTSVDGDYLNTYWADGLIIATPTGSTAYSLSAGGPILSPQTNVVVITPIAPHALTIRPVVVRESAVIETSVSTRGHPYVFAGDGRSEVIDEEGVRITIRKADHTVQLVTFPGSNYYGTLRNKLHWGQEKHFQ